MFKKILSSLILGSAFSFSGMYVGAASLQVSPISIGFSNNEKAKEVWLTNTSDTTIRAQTRVLEWFQKEQKDQLQPTKNLVASPVITEIKPGERQLIRILKVVPLSPQQEHTYRLLIDELPGAKKQVDQSGLQLLLQYSVPVFIASNQDIPSKNGITSLDNIKFSYQNNKFTVKNQANSHIRMSQLSYINPTGEKIPVISGLVGYVLANQTMSWDLSLPKQAQPNGKFELRINMDGAPQSLSLE